MSDYLTLQADIALWLVRDDLSASIPSFIRLAEAMHARDLRIQAMSRRARTEGADSQYMALPQGFLEMRRLSLIDTSGNLRSLEQVTPEAFRVRANGGHPMTYCVHRDIEFDAPLAEGVPLEMVYYAPFEALSAENADNWLVINAYDAYLYGSLLAAEPYLRNDERVSVWSAGYGAAVEALREAERRGRVNRGGQRFSMAGAGATP